MWPFFSCTASVFTRKLYNLKGEVYEKMQKMLFPIKDKRFRQEGFLEQVKQDFTAFINTFVFDKKKKLAVFDKHSPCLATKKIRKNNPKEEQIKTDNKENESKVSTNLKSQKDSIPPRPEFSMGMEEYGVYGMC